MNTECAPARPARRPVSFLLAVLLACAALVVAAAPSEAAITLWKYRTTDLSVGGFSSSADGCVETFTFVNGSEASVFYATDTFDSCEGTLVSSVYGEATPTRFTLARDLSSAHVTATLPLVDGATGEPAGELVLDDTWTATGRAVQVRQSYSEQLPGSYRFAFRLNGRQAPATVTGTVPLDEGFIGRFTVAEFSLTR